MALVLELTGCGVPATSPPQPPDMARAAPLEASGISEIRLDTVVGEIRTALKPTYGTLGEPVLRRVPADVGFEALRAAYDAELKGWTPEPALERHVRGGEAAAWKANGRVFAIALLPRPLYDRPTDYQVLVTLGSR